MAKNQFRFIWKLPRGVGHYISMHAHHKPELVYYPKGRGISVVDGEKVAFKEGIFMLHAPGVMHDELYWEEGEVICLGFEWDTPVQTQCLQDSDGAVESVLKAMLREVQRQQTGFQEMIRLKLEELRIAVKRCSTPTSSGKKFEYVINYFQEYYYEKISLRQCAATMGLSYDYFQHKFKEATGLSPMQYLQNERLRAAKKMLEQKGSTCTEIAFKCGFSTAAQFSAMFKRQYGQSPLQYQKNK